MENMSNDQNDNPNVITSIWPSLFVRRNKVTDAAKTNKITRGKPFSEREQDLLTVSTDKKALDTQSDIFFKVMIKENDRLSPTVKKAFKAQEEERARISGELHDTVAQWLASASYHSQSSKSLIAKSRFTDAIMEIDRVNDITKKCIHEIRRIILNLSPHLINELGLVNALQRNIEFLKMENSIEYNLVIDGKQSPLPWTHELTIYRVVVEALNNVKKHANASKVEIKLRFYPDKTKAIITDNGNGFDFTKTMKNTNHTGSIGLLVMQERAELVGGELKVKSAPGLGTKITLEIPAACKQRLLRDTV